MPGSCQALIFPKKFSKLSIIKTRLFFLRNRRQCKNRAQGKSGYCWSHRTQRKRKSVIFSQKNEVFLYGKKHSPKRALIETYKIRMKNRT